MAQQPQHIGKGGGAPRQGGNDEMRREEKAPQPSLWLGGILYDEEGAFGLRFSHRIISRGRCIGRFYRQTSKPISTEWRRHTTHLLLD